MQLPYQDGIKVCYANQLAAVPAGHLFFLNSLILLVVRYSCCSESSQHIGFV